MTTAKAILDVTQYVRVNASPGSFILQSHRDTVRVAFSDVKPARANEAFHELGGASRESMLTTGYVESGVWVLAMTDRSSLTITPYLATKAVLTDRANRDAMVSMTGETHVGFKIDDVSVNFQYSEQISTYDIKDGGIESGTGTTGSLKSMATISTGLGVGTALLESKDAIRYRAGHECHSAMSVVFGVPEVGVNQYAGFLNSTDGWCVGYQGDVFGLWFIEGGNVNFIPQSTFNWDKLDGTGASNYNINPQTGQLYRLSYTWHGFLDMLFEVRTDDSRWVPVHKMVFVNSAIETHLENPNLPLAIKIERLSGTGEDVTIKTGSWRAGVIAGIDERNSADRWFAHTELDSPLINARNNIFTVYNKPIFQGKTNHIIAELGIITFDSTANKTVAVYGTKGATLTGNTLPFVDFDSTNSILSYSPGGVATGGSRGPATVIKAGGDRRTDVRGTGIFIYPGEYLTFEVDPVDIGVNGSFSISARFKELH